MLLLISTNFISSINTYLKNLRAINYQKSINLSNFPISVKMVIPLSYIKNKSSLEIA